MPNKKDDLFKDERPFNMAVFFLQRLDTRLDEAQRASIAGDFVTWYRLLHAIYRQVYPKIEEKKDFGVDKKFKERFDKCRESLNSYYKQNDPRLNGQIQSIAIGKLEIELAELDKEIGSICLKYEMLFPKLQNKKTDENIAKFIQMYVKPRILKKAISDPEYMKKPIVDVEKMKKSYVDYDGRDELTKFIETPKDPDDDEPQQEQENDDEDEQPEDNESEASD
jgi:hypothetical protein